jgi:hypothetical protein
MAMNTVVVSWIQGAARQPSSDVSFRGYGIASGVCFRDIYFVDSSFNRFRRKEDATAAAILAKGSKLAAALAGLASRQLAQAFYRFILFCGNETLAFESNFGIDESVFRLAARVVKPPLLGWRVPTPLCSPYGPDAS